jgi:hypothetical protein
MDQNLSCAYTADLWGVVKRYPSQATNIPIHLMFSHLHFVARSSWELAALLVLWARLGLS